MIIVSDTGPLRYLIETGDDFVLPILYGQILIPAAVRDELIQPQTPKHVRESILQPPEWLSVINNMSELENRRHRGALQALILATTLRADFLLVDDAAARRKAVQTGLLINGTLGILAEAAKEGLLKLPAAYDRLANTSFRVKRELMERLLQIDLQRREGQIT